VCDLLFLKQIGLIFLYIEWVACKKISTNRPRDLYIYIQSGGKINQLGVQIWCITPSMQSVMSSCGRLVEIATKNFGVVSAIGGLAVVRQCSRQFTGWWRNSFSLYSVGSNNRFSPNINNVTDLYIF